MDSRYGAYMHEYINMNNLLGIENNSKVMSYKEKVLKNLMNWEYFYTSLQVLKKKGIKALDYFNKSIVAPQDTYTYSKGYKEAILLPDGSHLYSSTYIAMQLEANKYIPMGGGGYKIDRKKYDSLAIKGLISLLELYQAKGVKLSFVLTPYHPNVFKKGETRPVRRMKTITKKVTEISEEHNISVYGSFFPDKLGCLETEYLDFMHATTECLTRIDFRN